MKQSLKYGILLIFALLLHSMMTEATGEFSIPDTLSHDKCFVSQARPMRNAIEKFYLFCSPLSCDMGHADLPNVPTDKNFLRLTTRQCEYKGLMPSLYEHSSHLYTHDPEDPIMHYIYGQRKIVI
ncbi:hypothetical protein [Bacteroides sp.]